MRMLRGAALGLFVSCLALSAQATPFSLSDQNSSALVHTEATDPDGSGMLSWTVDGVEQLFEQWFYLRVGAGSFDRIDSFGLVGEHASDTNPFIDDRLDTLAVRYGSADALTIDLTLTLRGGPEGSGVSDVAETVVLTNQAQEAISVSLIQYIDLDLSFETLSDVVELVDAHTVRQRDSLGTSTFEEVFTPSADVVQLALFPDILDLLDVGLGLEDARDAQGPDDVTFALQWDLQLDPGQAFILSKDKRLEGVQSLPEPATSALMAAAAIGLGFSRRQNRR